MSISIQFWMKYLSKESFTHMKIYINIFLTLVMPINILFTAVATVYYSTNFAFSKAIRLGTIAGVLIGISVSLLLALILLIIRIIHNHKRKSTIHSSAFTQEQDFIIPDSTVYEKDTKILKKTSNTDKIPIYSDEIEEKFILLMDKKLAYEVSLNAINHGKVGDIIHEDMNEGSILLRTKNEEIRIVISSLTKHTSEVKISSTIDNSTMKNIISMLKEKEYSFIEY